MTRHYQQQQATHELQQTAYVLPATRHAFQDLLEYARLTLLTPQEQRVLHEAAQEKQAAEERAAEEREAREQPLREARKLRNAEKRVERARQRDEARISMLEEVLSMPLGVGTIDERVTVVEIELYGTASVSDARAKMMALSFCDLRQQALDTGVPQRDVNMAYDKKELIGLLNTSKATSPKLTFNQLRARALEAGVSSRDVNMAATKTELREMLSALQSGEPPHAASTICPKPGHLTCGTMTTEYVRDRRKSITLSNQVWWRLSACARDLGIPNHRRLEDPWIDGFGIGTRMWAPRPATEPNGGSSSFKVNMQLLDGSTKRGTVQSSDSIGMLMQRFGLPLGTGLVIPSGMHPFSLTDTLEQLEIGEGAQMCQVDLNFCCDDGHALQCTDFAGGVYKHGWQCNTCGANKQGLRLCCPFCFYDLCATCAASKLLLLSEVPDQQKSKLHRKMRNSKLVEVAHRAVELISARQVWQRAHWPEPEARKNFTESLSAQTVDLVLQKLSNTQEIEINREQILRQFLPLDHELTAKWKGKSRYSRGRAAIKRRAREQAELAVAELLVKADDDCLAGAAVLVRCSRVSRNFSKLIRNHVSWSIQLQTAQRGTTTSTASVSLPLSHYLCLTISFSLLAHTSSRFDGYCAFTSTAGVCRAAFGCWRQTYEDQSRRHPVICYGRPFMSPLRRAVVAPIMTDSQHDDDWGSLSVAEVLAQ